MITSGALYVRSNYKCCERLNKFVGNKVIITQELNAYQCKEQVKKFFFNCTHACEVISSLVTRVQYRRMMATQSEK
jgi:hypothetical protein